MRLAPFFFFSAGLDAGRATLLALPSVRILGVGFVFSGPRSLRVTRGYKRGRTDSWGWISHRTGPPFFFIFFGIPGVGCGSKGRAMGERRPLRESRRCVRATIAAGAYCVRTFPQATGYFFDTKGKCAFQGSSKGSILMRFIISRIFELPDAGSVHVVLHFVFVKPTSTPRRAGAAGQMASE